MVVLSVDLATRRYRDVGIAVLSGLPSAPAAHFISPTDRMVTFSITVFDTLHQLGWPRYNTNWSGQRSAVESFPTQAWRTIQLAPLPGKSKKGVNTSEWCSQLCATTGLRFVGNPSHDEIQAAIAGLAGLLLLDGQRDRCEFAGDEPFIADGQWREGVIISPKWPAA